MTAASLSTALAVVSAARVRLADQREQIAKLEAEIEPARVALDASEAKLTAALGAERLGDGTPTATKRARADRDAAAEQVRGIESALSVLRGRVVESAQTVDRLEHDARTAALPLAERLAEHELERARRLFESAASALATWHALDTFVRGSEITGSTQSEASGVGAILASYGLRASNGAVIAGKPDGSTRPMSTADLVAYLEPEQVAAE